MKSVTITSTPVLPSIPVVSNPTLSATKLLISLNNKFKNESVRNPYSMFKPFYAEVV